MGGIVSFLFGWEDAQDHARRYGNSYGGVQPISAFAQRPTNPVKPQSYSTVVRTSYSKPKSTIVPSTNTVKKNSLQKISGAASNVVEPIKYYAKYVCPTCKLEWNSDWEGDKLYEKCKDCFTRVLPTRQELPERCFGEYRCPDCRRYWSSAWSWTGYRQKCFKCQVYTFAFSRRPLLKSDEDDNINEKVHRSDLCEKCVLLGRKCTTLRRIIINKNHIF